MLTIWLVENYFATFNWKYIPLFLVIFNADSEYTFMLTITE